MDIIFKESDIKAIIANHLTAKGNQVESIIVQVELPDNKPGISSIMANLSLINPTKGSPAIEKLLADDSPNRPKFSLKCSVSNE